MGSLNTHTMPVSLATEPPQTGGEPRYVKSYLRRGSSSVRLKQRDTLRRSSVSKIQKARARTLKMTIVIGETKIVAAGCKMDLYTSKRNALYHVAVAMTTVRDKQNEFIKQFSLSNSYYMTVQMLCFSFSVCFRHLLDALLRHSRVVVD